MPRPAPAAVRYTIVPADPEAHCFEASLEIDAPDPQGQRVSMPVWIEGSYLVREFARQVVRIDARCGARAVGLRKIDTHTWEAEPCEGTLVLRWQVYAWDLSVRTACLDAHFGFFNASSVFLRPHGRDQEPCQVQILPPTRGDGGSQAGGARGGTSQGYGSRAGGWRVATTLPRAGARPGGFGGYRAQSYEELADHPVLMGPLSVTRFMVNGVPHEIAVSGRHDADLPRLGADLARVCAAQARLFEPRSGALPFERYLFQIMLVGEGYGGLEHRSSTALICGRHDLPYRGMSGSPEAYRGLLGLASHEYFHSWHVRRIRPAALARPDPDRENFTRLLWVFEGFTSYYDELMLVRAGLVGMDDYLGSLTGTVSRVLRGPGRRVQSVAESSFDAWIKYYRQDENSPNSVVSYYAKGALVALCLDLEIRSRSGGRRSLDDFMRLLWRRFGRHFELRREGLAEDGVAPLLREATGLDLTQEVQAWAHGTDELPLAALLQRVGLHLSLKAPEGDAPSLGVKLAQNGAALTITTAYSGQAAMRAGLSAGDQLVAFEGLRMDEASLKRMLGRHRAGDRVRVHAFRRDELMAFDVRLQAPEPTDATLTPDEQAEAGALALRRAWLGLRAHDAIPSPEPPANPA
jgi:predicted metalloprotease with PDZ domain